jgi:hypothetical protein
VERETVDFVAPAVARLVVPRDELAVVRDVVARDAVERDVTVPRDASLDDDAAWVRDTVVRDVARAVVFSDAPPLAKSPGITRDATTPSAANAGPTSNAINKNNGLCIIITMNYYITNR